MAIGEPIGGLRSERQSCLVYDVKKKELIAEFDSITECAKWLGISKNLASHTMIRKHKNSKNRLGISIAIRKKPA